VPQISPILWLWIGMDSVTQFVLGASVASLGLGPKLGWRAVVAGGLIATLPDLDSFVPYVSSLDKMTYHRGFSHSLFTQTIVSPVIAAGIMVFFKKYHLDWYRVLATVWLCLITHSLLDSLTTYGTQLFWPLTDGSPVALPSVFIIDPLYTILLIVGVIGFLYLANKNRRRALKFNRLFLCLSVVYLSLGVSAHFIVKHKAMALPQLKGKRVHVQPTPFTILYWQVLGVDKTHFFVGATSLLSSCSLIELNRFDRLPSAAPYLQDLPKDVKRFEWFTDGFYTYRTTSSGLEISDLRIGFSGNYPFTYQVAERESHSGDKGDSFIVQKAQRVRQAKRDLQTLKALYKQAQTRAPGCQ